MSIHQRWLPSMNTLWFSSSLQFQAFLKYTNLVWYKSVIHKGINSFQMNVLMKIYWKEHTFLNCPTKYREINEENGEESCFKFYNKNIRMHKIQILASMSKLN